MLGYNEEVVTIDTLKLDEKNHYKIGYVDGDTIYISEDCFKFIYDNYETETAYLLKDALYLLLLEVDRCNVDTDESIERIGELINNETATEIYADSFSRLIDRLIEVCDAREYHIPRDYF